MAQVDFYVLAGEGEQERAQFACRLAEKAYRLKHRVQILAADRVQAERLDELLWTWRDGSFVPHGLEGSDEGTQAPVIISTDGGRALEGFDLLINLSHSLPESASAFPRVAEIVTSDEDTRQRGRARYAGYREQGHVLETHKL